MYGNFLGTVRTVQHVPKMFISTEPSGPSMKTTMPGPKTTEMVKWMDKVQVL